MYRYFFQVLILAISLSAIMSNAYAVEAYDAYPHQPRCEMTGTLPVVSTRAVDSITTSSARSGGVVTSDGGETVTERGVCWSRDPHPTIADSHTVDGHGEGSFTSSLTGLQRGKKYYLRAYATNSAGTAYGQEVEFTTLCIPITTRDTVILTMSDFPYHYGDSTFTSSTADASIHHVHFQILDACDSVVILYFRIGQGSHEVITAEECGSYFWAANNQTYYESGVYTRNYTNAYGLPSTDTLKLTIYPAISAPTLTAVNNSGCTIPNGSITVNSPTGTGYMYSINNGTFQSDNTFGGLAADTYTVIVKNSNGCVVSASKTITKVTSTLRATITANTPCEGGTIELTATPTGVSAGSELTYEWTGPSFASADQNLTIPNVTMSHAGLYKVKITDAATGCFIEKSIDVTVHPAPNTPLLSVTNNTACVAHNGIITVESPVGVGYRYSLNNGAFQTGRTFNGLDAGEYIVTVKNGNGCTATASRTVSTTESTLGVDITSNTPCENGTLTLTATPTGIPSESNVTYEWETPTFVSADQNLTVPNVTTSHAGTYWLTATETATGCVFKKSHNVTIHSLPDVNISGDNEFCDGESRTLTATGGDAYSWNTGATSPTIDVTSSGPYTVTVNNTATGCSATKTHDVTVHNLPTASISGDDELCAGDRITLTASGDGSYKWSTGSTGSSISVGSSGTYTVTVTNTHGCTATATHDVTVHDLPHASISGDNEICSGESTTLTASGGSSYKWNTWLGSTGSSISVSSSGTYKVTVTDSHGCTATASHDVTVHSLPDADISGDDEACEGESITLTASGGGSYWWSTWEMGSSIHVSSSGTYTVKVTNSHGCTATAEHTVTIHDAPQTPSLTTVDNTSCTTPNGSITVSAPTGFNYRYSLNDGSFQSSTTFSELNAGNYVVTVKNGDGCTSSATTSIATEGNTLNATITANAPCENGTLQLNASPSNTNVSYEWTGPNGFSSTVQNPSINNVSLSNSGLYTLVITETGTNCSYEETYTVTIHSQPSATIEGGSDICAGGSTTLTASGGNSYSWNTGANTQSVDVNAAGTYTVTVTDANGCTSTAIQTVSVHEAPQMPTFTVTDYTVCIPPNGSITVNTPTGTGYTYSINGGSSQSSNRFLGLIKGDYTVTVQNEYGCSSSATATVNSDIHLPDVSISSNTPCLNDTLELTVTTSSTFASFEWTGPNFCAADQNLTIPNVAMEHADTYTLKVTDLATGCATVETHDVSVHSLPTVSISGDRDICSGSSTILLASGGISYNWNTGAITPYIEVGSSGVFIVTATDVNGCSDTASHIVIAHEKPQIPDLTVTHNTTCIPPNGSIVVNSPIGNGYNYFLDGGIQQLSNRFLGLLKGDYTVSVQNEYGCTSSMTVTVNTNQNVPDISISSNTPCINGILELTATTSCATSSFEWIGTVFGSADQNLTIPNVQAEHAGLYTLIVTDTLTGCSNKETHDVTINPLPIVNISGSTDICAGTGTTLTATGGNAYSWSTGANTASIDVSTSGVYTVTVTDANGCSDTASHVVTVHDIPVINVYGDTSICRGETAILHAEGADDFEWSFGASGSTVTLEPAYTSAYSVTGTSDGCSYVKNFNVSVHSLPPTPTLYVGNKTSCADTNGRISVYMPAHVDTTFYTYSLNNGVPQDSRFFKDLTAGEYVVTVINGYGCTSSENAEITCEENHPIVNASANTPCEHGNLELSASTTSEDVSYEWSGPNFHSTLQNPVISNFSASNSGTYSVTVTDNITQCPTTKYVLVEAQSLPDISISGPSEVCYTEEGITLTASGGDNYSWTTGETGPSIRVYTTGTYSVTATVGNCSATATHNIVVYPNPSTPNLSHVDNSSCTSNDGSISVIAPVSGCSYALDDGAFGSNTTFNDLTSGLHVVTVKDAHNCTSFATVNVATVNSSLRVDVSANTPCEEGDLVLTASATTNQNVTYSWTGPGNFYTAPSQVPYIVIQGIARNQTGIYKVIVREASTGCKAEAQCKVSVKKLPKVSIEGGTDICESETTELRASSAHQYSWNTGSTHRSIEVTTSGIYTVTVTDNNGCTATASKTVEVHEKPIITISGNNTTCSGIQTTLEASGAHNYVWNDPHHTEGSVLAVYPAANTTYIVTGISEYGCTSTASMPITVKYGDTQDTSAVACEFFIWHPVEGVSQIDSVSGIHVFNYVNGDGCLSKKVLHLTIFHPRTVEEWESSCNEYTWARNHQSYTETGDYSTEKSEYGCIVTYILHLTIYKDSEPEVVEECDMYQWPANGQTYTESADVTFTYPSPAGCDLTRTLNLVINHNEDEDIEVTRDYSYYWADKNETYTRSGTYTYEFTADNGCPSVKTLHLTIKNEEDTCIHAYMEREESCAGHDGVAKVFIPDTIKDDCIILWDLNNGETSDEETVDSLTKGTYPIEVRYKRPSDEAEILIYKSKVKVTKAKECDDADDEIYVEVSGPSEVPGVCNGSVPVTFTAYAAGGAPPYNFSGWQQISSTTAIKTISIGSGRTSVVCSVSDANGNRGSGKMLVFGEKLGCPIDPNEIKGPAGYSEEKHFVNINDKMNYSIYFENDPDFAMAPASRVKITYDVPDQHLLSSFRLSDFGFGDFVFTVPSNVSSYSHRLDVSDSLGVWVDVTAGIDIINSQIFWIFQSIDPATGAEPVDAQMGFLLVNDSLQRGEGYVSFYINPESDLQTGDTVAAEAMIIFDQNDPIGTNVWTNTFDAEAPTSMLYAEMNELDSLYCTFTFEAEDDANGSGVRSVEVYVSVNNAEYVSIGSVEPDNTFSYALENGDFYQFMSIATDNVGNKEAFKDRPDTAVNFNVAPAELVLDGNIFYEYVPENTYIGTFSTTDDVENQTFVYELVSGEGGDDNALFTIVGDELRTDTTFMCSRQTEYSIRVRSTDIGGMYIEKNFVVTEILSHTTPLTSFYKQICEGNSIDFNGRLLTEAGTYYDTLSTAEGCDSIILWYVNINPSYHNPAIDTTVCDQFVWNDSTYTESDVISQTFVLSTGCDSVVTYNLTVNYSTEGIDEQIACDSFTWIDDSTYTESTITPTFTLTNAAGCDSVVTLHLTVNYSYEVTDAQTICASELPYTWNGVVFEAAGIDTARLQTVDACDSVVIMTLTVNPVYEVADAQTICASELPYTWNGVVFEAAGIDTARLQTVDACDSVVIMTLTVNPVYEVADAQTICASELPYTWNGVVFEAAGIDTARLQTVDACDSVVIMTLTVNPIYEVADAQTICASELPYTWNGVVFEAAGIDTARLQTVDACDSVVIMTLTVNPVYEVADAQTICASELPYTWNGVVFEAAGIDTARLQTVDACDSVVIMTLMVNPVYEVADAQTICASELPYTWNGVVFEAAGVDTARLQTVDACDSVVIMTLTVNPVYEVTDAQTICASELPYTWNGVVFEASGVDTARLQTVETCDSVVIMTLYVNPTYNVTDERTVCDNELPILWNGIEFTAAGMQTVTLNTVNDCDSVVTMTLHVNPTYNVTDERSVCNNELPILWNGVEFTAAGTQTTTLSTVNDCDSVVTMTLTVNPIYQVSDAKTICASELPLVWNSIEFTAAGTQTVTLNTVNDCDSVVTMSLHVTPTYNVTDERTVCDNELPLVWNGIEFTAAGTQTATLSTVNDCDSVVTMTLYVNPTYNVTDERSVCDNELPILWNGIEFTAAGTQTVTLSTINDCDSVVTMTLHVNPTYNVTDERTVCDNELPLVWNGVQFTAAGTQTATLSTANDCDSVVTMTLHVNPTYNVTDERTVCDNELPLVWNGIQFTAAGTQTATLSTVNDCDSVVTMTLHVNPTYNVTDERTVCDNELPLVWNGVEFTAAGTQTVTLSTVNDCDSVVTMTLHVNPTYNVTDERTVCENELPLVWNGVQFTAAGTQTATLSTVNDCDSVVTMTLTMNPIYQVSDAQTICASELPYTWNGVVFTEAGTQTTTLSTVNNCDSVVTMTLTVNPIYQVSDAQTICASELPYTWNGVVFTEAGTQTTTLSTINDCDSVVTMTLTVNPIYQVGDAQTICASELPYTWNGVVFTEAGTQTTTLSTVNDCDSVVTMTLHVNPTYNVTDERTVCENELPLVWNGVHFTAACTQTTTLSTVNDCDSVVTMTLTVNHPAMGIDEHVACGNFTWINDSTYTESTTTPTYTYVGGAANGCDSIVTLHLTINHPVTELVEVTACGSFTWIDDSTYTVSTTTPSYTYVGGASNGCDSIVTLHLTINQPTMGIDNQEACDSLLWIDGVTYYESTSDANAPSFLMTNAAGCDSIVTLNLSLNHSVTVDYYLTISDDDLPYTFGDTTFLPGTVQSGDYTVVLETADGCDSIVTLHLTVTDIKDYLMNVAMNVYPNPTNGKVNVQLSMNNVLLSPNAEIQLYDMYGKWLRTVKVEGKVTELDLSSFAAGVYFVKAVDGQRMIGIRKVVKE